MYVFITKQINTEKPNKFSLSFLFQQKVFILKYNNNHNNF